MNSLSQIINFNKHPLDNLEYINRCKNKIFNNLILVLNNFLTKKCLNELIIEALQLEEKAFYCSQNHTILLNKYDNSLDKKDPLNFKVKSNIDLLKIRFYSSVKENFYSEYIYFSKKKIFHINKNFLDKIEQIDFINPLSMSRKNIYISITSRNFLLRKSLESFIKEILSRIYKLKKKN